MNEPDPGAPGEVSSRVKDDGAGDELRLLLIDDNPDDRELVRRELRRELPQARFLEAHDAASLERGLAEGPHVVVTDYALRWTDGLTVAREVKRQDPERVVIMFTGTGNEEIAADGLRSSLDDYVVKSARHLVRLTLAVRGAIERTRLRREHKLLAQERELLLARETALRAEAERANRAKDELLSIVSHELRTPLNALMGWVQLLRGGKLDAPQRERALETIERNGKLQARLIQDLIDLSSVFQGVFAVERRPLELEPIVAACVESARPDAAARGLALAVSVVSSGTTVDGDPLRIQQIVSHLLENAIKFTPAGGTVTLRLEAQGGVARLSVSDTGRGIAPGFLPHVFDGFRQADRSTTRVQGGLGLGLTLVKHMVERHGGKVHAESAGPGRGATFVVELPLAGGSAGQVAAEPSPGASAFAEPRPGASSLAGLSLLVVEDDHDTRDALEAVLREDGASVVAVSSAADALSSLEARWPDVLVSDIAMPNEDGYSLRRKVKRLEERGSRRLASIALTAHARGEDRQRSLAAGFDEHLAKPVDLEALLVVIARLAGRSPRSS